MSAAKVLQTFLSLYIYHYK